MASWISGVHWRLALQDKVWAVNYSWFQSVPFLNSSAANHSPPCSPKAGRCVGVPAAACPQPVGARVGNEDLSSKCCVLQRLCPHRWWPLLIMEVQAQRWQSLFYIPPPALCQTLHLLTKAVSRGSKNWGLPPTFIFLFSLFGKKLILKQLSISPLFVFTWFKRLIKV